MRTTTEPAARPHLSPTPWTVRPHPGPCCRQCRWLWSCDDCETGGTAATEPTALHNAADHYARQHAPDRRDPA